MNSLKNALGKQSEKGDSTQNKLTSNKTFNKSKNASIWTLDEDEDDNIEKGGSGFNEKLYSEFSRAILGQVEKNQLFQQIFFYEILQKMQTENQYQDEAKSLQILNICTQKMIEKEETSEKVKQFLSQLVECIIKRAKKLKKKEKKSELQQFDKIVKNNFKKKSIPQFIGEQKLNKNEQDLLINNKAIRNSNINERKNRSKSIGQGSSSKRNPSSSSEGKLGSLISSAILKDEKKQEQNQENQERQENVSFSTVLSQTMVQRQRRPKDQKKEKKDKVTKAEQKIEKIQENEGNDEAFIFYRPKVGKKK